MEREVTVQGYRFTVQSWTYGMKQKALRAATTWKESRGSLEPDVDPYVLNDHMLEQCVVGWSLTNEDGLPLEITIENIHNVKPPEIIEQLLTEVQSLNGISPGERKKS